jgi:hypothetical protein
MCMSAWLWCCIVVYQCAVYMATVVEVSNIAVD